MTRELTSLDHLRSQIAAWRSNGKAIGFVPTMGALHAGHLALVDAARAQSERVVVSIFVNPTQFAPHEDFSRYPRPLAEDMARLRDAGVDAAWLPDTALMYPEGFATQITLDAVTEPLEGAHRPGHFAGVATVVAKLLNQVQPDLAFFGEKDYQQLLAIRQLVRDLDVPVQVVGVPTLREADGLAMSSRNQYLSPQEREVAAELYAALQTARAALREGSDAATVLTNAQDALLSAGFRAIDYLALADADTLTPLERWQPGQNARLLAAAHLGTTRLIDNLAV